MYSNHTLVMTWHWCIPSISLSTHFTSSLHTPRFLNVCSTSPPKFLFFTPLSCQLLLDFMREVIGGPTILLGNSIGSLAALLACAGMWCHHPTHPVIDTQKRNLGKETFEWWLFINFDTLKICELCPRKLGSVYQETRSCSTSFFLYLTKKIHTNIQITNMVVKTYF